MQKGFTLIELMIVVAIIGILAAFAVPEYSKYIERSNGAVALSKLAEYKINASENFAKTGSVAGISAATATYDNVNVEVSAAKVGTQLVWSCVTDKTAFDNCTNGTISATYDPSK